MLAMILHMCVLMLECVSHCAQVTQKNVPSSVKWLVIRLHWLLITSHYHLKVSGSWNQRLWWLWQVALSVCVNNPEEYLT